MAGSSAKFIGTKKFLGWRIAEARKARGISVEDAAKLIGVTNATMIRYEQSVVEPTASRLATLCDHLGLALDECFAAVSPHTYTPADFGGEPEQASGDVSDVTACGSDTYPQ